MDLQNLCFEVIEIVRPIGAYIKQQRENFQDILVEKKGVRDFVTEVDTNAEKRLVTALSKILPSAGFITEEKTVEQSDKEYLWIIDPLDGTMNYVHGIPIYSISIGLQYKNEIILGVVFEVANNEMFYSWKDAPAYCNGKTIHISGCNNLGDALIATGFPYIRNNERTQKISETLKYFLDNGRDIRRLGTAATDLCYVACGRMDVYYEGFLNIWDIAAGIIIAENAGAFVSDFKGERNFHSGQIVATNPDIKDTVLKGVSLMPGE
ncbi:MAG: inositol monophosphatase [Chitinophagales bacterium]|nr:inositol monophosphatase [Chitinophagales bacterium]MBP9881705.1 inositol monophosphatase [Chitinophagales bacterium]